MSSLISFNFEVLSHKDLLFCLIAFLVLCFKCGGCWVFMSMVFTIPLLLFFGSFGSTSNTTPSSWVTFPSASTSCWFPALYYTLLTLVWTFIHNMPLWKLILHFFMTDLCSYDYWYLIHFLVYSFILEFICTVFLVIHAMRGNFCFNICRSRGFVIFKLF